MDTIALLDPFVSQEGGYMEIVGQKINNELSQEYLKRLEAGIAVSLEEKQQPELDETKEEHVASSGLSIVLGSKRLFLTTFTQRPVSSILTVYNTGSVAVHFEWVRLKEPNGFGIDLSSRQGNRFYFRHKNGIILPGSAYDFPVIFYSNTPGFFTEKWKLCTMPELSNQHELIVELQANWYNIGDANPSG
jgi:hypothetical protein